MQSHNAPRAAVIVTIAVMVLGGLVQLGTPAVGATRSQPGNAIEWEPTSDWCGWTWRDNGGIHNGWDIWTQKWPGTGGISGSKGFPVQLAADGILREVYLWPGTVSAYGLRFWHPSLGLSTHYWHMMDMATKTSYVEGLTVGTTYPAGTFLGYQGDATTVGSVITHLHVTVWNSDAADQGSVSTSSNPGNAGLSPTGFFGRNLDALSGGTCWMAAEDVHYRGPLPQSDHPYPNNFGRWYVIVNYDTTATVTRAEFCDLITEANFDFVRVYNYDIAVFNTYSGTLTPPNVLSSAVSAGSQAASRVLFVRLDTDSSVTAYGFRVCNFHSS